MGSAALFWSRNTSFTGLEDHSTSFKREVPPRRRLLPQRTADGGLPLCHDGWRWWSIAFAYPCIRSDAQESKHRGRCKSELFHERGSPFVMASQGTWDVVGASSAEKIHL